MVSVFPASFQPEPMPEIPFFSFETGFSPWGCPEPDLPAAQSPRPTIFSSSPGSEDSIKNHVKNSCSSNSDDQKPGVASVMDERRRRRMIWNRVSAGRSRMRKQKHLENLRNQVNCLRIENRQLTNKVRLVLYHCHVVSSDNDQLMSERFVLQQKLADIRRAILLQQPSAVHSDTTMRCHSFIGNRFGR